MLHRTLAVIWIALAAVGLVGTWAFNLAFMTAPQEFGYLAGWFANAASSSAAVDLLVVAVAASIFMVVEGWRLGWSKWVWILVPLSFLVAIAFTFPLFLGLRELALSKARNAPAPARPQPIPEV